MKRATERQSKRTNGIMENAVSERLFKYIEEGERASIQMYIIVLWPVVSVLCRLMVYFMLEKHGVCPGQE